jgi:hypothetical protein
MGERPVEELAVGDYLPTVFGGGRRIQWITRSRLERDETGKPWKKHARPIRIAASALAHNVPYIDLYVTSGHALLIDGLLIPAGSLVNGRTVELYAAEEYDTLEFFQIKLESHDVIYAAGAMCESLLSFDKTESTFEQYCSIYGRPQEGERHCAPIVCNGARSEISSRLRSTMSPWLGPQKIDLIRDQLDERAMTFLPVEVTGQQGALLG